MCVCCVLVSQSRPAVCDPMDYSPPGYSVHGILQAEYWRQNTPGRMDCHSFLQGISLTQESNPGRLHCRQILYSLSHHYLGMLRSTDQEIAIEKTVYYSQIPEEGIQVRTLEPIQATAKVITQRAKGGYCGQEPLLCFHRKEQRIDRPGKQVLDRIVSPCI